MENKPLAVRVVDRMFNSDWFSQWLGIERVLVDAGKCVLKMKVRKEMLNGFQILHGGITYSLADSALAFASNSHGRMSVSIETSISHVVACQEGDEITATAEEVSLTNKIAIYHIVVTNQQGVKVALFKGTVYRTGKEWFPADTNIKNN
jgi:acyl-CoA thioesterase